MARLHWLEEHVDLVVVEDSEFVETVIARIEVDNNVAHMAHTVALNVRHSIVAEIAVDHDMSNSENHCPCMRNPVDHPTLIIRIKILVVLIFFLIINHGSQLSI